MAPDHDSRLRRVPAGAPVEDVIGALVDDGAVIVHDLLSHDVVQAINAEVQPFVDLADPDMRHLNPGVQFFHSQTRHVSGLAGKSPTFATEVMIHPLLMAVCDTVLGPSCARYQLNLAHLLERLPGAADQFWHQDEIVWNLVPEPKPELQLASVIALVDFTADNGATRVFPGSHRWEKGRYPNDDEAVVAEMPAGSAIVYLGSTFHGGGAHHGAAPRRGVHLSYTLGWLRTEENNYLAVPPEQASRLPRRCQEVLGYAVHDAIERGGGYLGMLDLRDPIELFQEGWPGAAQGG
ncbi:MAG TPA: phytanoyl-CoA dioxygenase family protein [Acidimicrobiales bacterium]|nr:phytanoyl-CoA dioxygenase family protein [Acidimicrobiales bacterium]